MPTDKTADILSELARLYRSWPPIGPIVVNAHSELRLKEIAGGGAIGMYGIPLYTSPYVPPGTVYRLAANGQDVYSISPAKQFFGIDWSCKPAPWYERLASWLKMWSRRIFAWLAEDGFPPVEW